MSHKRKLKVTKQNDPQHLQRIPIKIIRRLAEETDTTTYDKLQARREWWQHKVRQVKRVLHIRDEE